VWVFARMPGERPNFPRTARSSGRPALRSLPSILGVSSVLVLLLVSLIFGASSPSARPEEAQAAAAAFSSSPASPASFALVNLTANNTTVDVTMAFNVSVDVVNLTGGALNASNYTFAWSGLPPFVHGDPGSGCSSSYSINANNNSSVLNCTAAAPGTFHVSVSATNWTSSQTNTSSTLLIVVNALPSLSSFHISKTNITLGTMIWLNATGSGGTDSYYAYSGLPIGCAGNSSSFSCTPSRTGIYNVTVEVLDAYGYNSTSISVKVTVSSTKSTTPPVSATGWAVILGIVVVGALITIALLLQARKEDRAGQMGREETPPEPSQETDESPPSGGGAPTPPPPPPGSAP
jgi:hypothetical protein